MNTDAITAYLDRCRQYLEQEANLPSESHRPALIRGWQIDLQTLLPGEWRIGVSVELDYTTIRTNEAGDETVMSRVNITADSQHVRMTSENLVDIRAATVRVAGVIDNLTGIPQPGLIVVRTAAEVERDRQKHETRDRLEALLKKADGAKLRPGHSLHVTDSKLAQGDYPDMFGARGQRYTITVDDKGIATIDRRR